MTLREESSTPALAPRSEATTRALSPFGLEVRFPSGTRWEDIDPELVHGWVRLHRVVVFRGVRSFDKATLPLQARRLGPLQVWPFGAVNELVPDKQTKNYLYTDREVPLHWDGAFAGKTPRYLFFHCVAAPEVTGGETVFVDTTRVWANADEPTRDRWRSLRFLYETKRIVHYGGTFTARVVDQHPITGETVLRFAEPVDDLNPVHVSAEALSPLESAALVTELRAAMRLPGAVLAHPWEAGDIVVADNHALLHGRRSFAGGERRHIRRVNVHDPIERGFWLAVRESIRIRRPEFMVAEVPILLIPALLVSAPLASGRFVETVALFFLLFHFGDMANCLADRDLDAVYKTHLTEAIYGLGVRNVRIQLAATSIGALVLATHLGWVMGRLDLAALVFIGLALGGAYSIPPFRFKGRGLLQVLTLWAVIFVGPMLLVVRTFAPAFPAPLLALVLCYGAMQEGIILVNTAEDLPEDTAAGIRTTAVALGLRGTVALATAMVALGGAGVAASLVALAPRELSLESGLLYLAPLACAYAWVVTELALVFRLVSARTEEEALEKLRPRARRMPLWITATAWTTLFAVVMLTYAR